MVQADGEAAVEALCILAKGLLASGQQSQAVKCLEAICHSSAPMPASAARHRLWLAQVLLQHTQNIPEATQHLQKAVSPARPFAYAITHSMLTVALWACSNSY